MLNDRIRPTTKRFALLGEHLGHTYSPMIHNTIFDLASADAVYLPLPFPQTALPEAVAFLRTCFGGFNVTIPYKEKIVPYLDELHGSAAIFGAVNTVVLRDRRLLGYNTDGLGFIRALREADIPVDRQRVLLLGGGGAARAVACEMLWRGGSVTLATRREQSALTLREALAKHLAGAANGVGWMPFDAIRGEYDLMVNCTPLGMMPNESACPADEKAISRCASVFDLVYNPGETMLLQRARAQGKKAAGGLGMLYYQALEAQKLWFGEPLLSAEQEQIVFEQFRIRIEEENHYEHLA